MVEIAILPPITDPIALLALLRAGDHLSLCFGPGWRLVKADAEVSERAVMVLRGGECWLDAAKRTRWPYVDAPKPGRQPPPAPACAKPDRPLAPADGSVAHV